MFNDYMYAGIPFSLKAIREFGETMYKPFEKAGQKARAVFRPEKLSESAEGAGAIVKSEEARSRERP